MQYRRSCAKGASFFFTLVTESRKQIFAIKENISLLNQAFEYTLSRHPFTVDALAILSDHIHCVWTLPQEESDFSTRWRIIKGHFTRHCPEALKRTDSKSRMEKGGGGIWQRRFWEHEIRGEKDYIKHLEYVHYNPVKHGYVRAPKDWPYSSFRRFVEKGIYESDWGAGEEIIFEDEIGKE